MNRLRKNRGETSLSPNKRPRLRRGAPALGALLLVSGGAVGGQLAANHFEKSNAEVAADAKQACESSLDSSHVKVTKEISLDKAHVDAILNYAMNPLTGHADSKELDEIGYTELQEAVSSGPRLVEVTVPFDANQPFSSKKELKNLLSDGALLSALINSKMADDQDPITRPVPVAGPAAYPEAPMTIVIGEQFC